MTDTVQFMLGQHDTALKQLVEGQELILQRLVSIDAALSERRGERRVVTVMWAGLSGAATALLVSIAKAWAAAHRP